MIIFTLFVVLLAATMAASLYFRKATEYLKASEAPWARLYETARAILADPNMPQSAAGFAAGAVMCAGCGCLTRGILLDKIRGKLKGESQSSIKTQREIHPMTPSQRALFSELVVNAIYYDSLRAPMSGFILRRLVAPWLRAVADHHQAGPKKSDVKALAESSRKTIESRPEGRKLLALQH